MTDFLNKISPRVRDNAKAWYEAAGTPEGAPLAENNQISEVVLAKSYENLKLLASLFAEGVPPREVSAMNLVMANNPRTNVSGLIKIARDKRADPVLAPWLTLLKEKLLPVKDTTKKDGEYDAEKEKAIEAKEKERRLEGAKLLYESTAIAHTLLLSLGLRKPEDTSELKSAADRYEDVLGRKLNDDEKFA